MTNRLKNSIYIAFFMLSVCGIFNAFSQTKPLILDSEKKTYELEGAHIGLFEDKKNIFTIANVKNKSFKTLKKSFPTLEDIESTYWLRFTLKNENNKYSSHWLLEAYDPKTSFLELYAVSGDTFELQEAGNLRPFFKKPIHHKNFTFNLNIPYGTSQTYYLKVRSNYPVGMHYVIRDYKVLMSYSNNEYFYLGLFYGFLLLMGIYNLSVFVNTKEKKYIYYVLYVISIAIFSMCWDGFGFQYLWPNYPKFNNYAFAIALYSSITWILLFANDFLELKTRLPLFSKLFKIYILLRGLYLLFGVFLYRELLFMLYIDIVPLLTAYTAGIILFFKQKYKPARFFVLSYSLLFLGFLIFIGENLRLVPSNIFSVYALNGGILMEAFFLSLALTDRLRVEIKERNKAYETSIVRLKENKRLNAQIIQELEEKEKLKDKVNRELEEKVAERTKELTIAHEQLSEQKKHIESISQELDKQNWVLKKEIKNMEKSLIINKSISFDEFEKIFPDNESCDQFLHKLKENHGFTCKKCSATEYVKGPSLYSRRCTDCNYVETITANTIFHNLKFPLNKAFYLLYTYVTLKKSIAVTALAKEIELRPNTCWSFKKKIEEAQENLKKSETDNWEKIIFNI